MMDIYTWKDVERKLLLNRDKWGSVIYGIETFADTLVVTLKDFSEKASAENILTEILDSSYNNKNEKITLDLKDEYLEVEFEVDKDASAKLTKRPLFKNVLYQPFPYRDEMLQKELPGASVLAFHSYKGGVGRTLSLLAFAKAWSTLTDIKNPARLLIVDADIEAPGITWLTSEGREPSFSFLDLLEMIQTKDCADEIIELVADKVSELTVKMETEKSIVEHTVLPAYRYMEQLLDIYASPESLANSHDKKYLLAEVLSKLGEKVGAGLVLVDLRAGISEFSAPLLFDPRVKKYLVTSTSYQSVKGTEILLQQLCKGLPFDEDSKIPEIFLTMVQDNVYTGDIISELTSFYDEHIPEEDVSITDDIVTELPFASELVHLGSLRQILGNLEGRKFYTNILMNVQNSYFAQESAENELTRDEIIGRIHEFAQKQITAEGDGPMKVLMTDPIYHLIKKYGDAIPNAVIMGAKGSGKTFLYREILKSAYWGEFVSMINTGNLINVGNEGRKTAFIVPLLASGNASGFHEIIENAVKSFNRCDLKGKLHEAVDVNNRNVLLKYTAEEHNLPEWNDIWKNIILASFGSAYNSLEDLEEDLGEKDKNLVFLVDGLEELFPQTISSGTEKTAIMSLCRDVENEVGRKYHHFGLLIFLRKDMARDSITNNFEQFYSLHSSLELKWSSTEALRLAVWLVSQAVPGYYTEVVPIEKAPREVIDRTLSKLWGTKLGKPTSNEANSSRWILAALSDFNGQLQARDIIRFLEKATVSVGKFTYPDRYLMPAEIKKAVSDCSSEKITEIKQEIRALQPIFDILENASPDKKNLPFYSDTFGLSQAEEKIMKQEGYLRIENDKYYLPEIVRHALKFKYRKGARPKVLSLLLKQN